MTTIDEIRDIAFYVIRKLNDLINNFTTEHQQPQQPRPQPHFRQMTEEERRRSDERHEHIMRQIEEIERNFTQYVPPPPPPPSPSPSPQEMIGEFIKQDEERIIDLQKQAHEKRIILNYLLDELIQRRERKEDAIVIKLLEEEFERLRLERERLEKRIIELKEHIRFMQN